MEKIKSLKIQGYVFIGIGFVYWIIKIFLKSGSMFLSEEYFLGWFLIIIGNIWYIGARVAEILVKDKNQKK